MTHIKKPVGICLGLMLVIIASAAEAGAAEANTTKIIKSNASGSFVSAHFDFDHADLSTPASYVHGEGSGNAGKFTYQAVVEVAPDNNTCTVPGRVTGAGTEFALVGRVEVLRFSATGDLLFLNSTPKANPATLCADFSTGLPFPFFVGDETGVVTGGTGALVGATGSFSATEKGAFLSTDPAGKTGFGWFKSHVVMTVTLP